MNIVIAGGTGFIGSALVSRLVNRGDRVQVLTRGSRVPNGAQALPWDGLTEGSWAESVAAADAVVNLAGEGIAERRWTAARKASLLTSRTVPTALLVGALARTKRERVVVSASAIGFYGDRNEETLDESSAPGRGFLAELTQQWEAAAAPAADHARLAIVRFGIVLDPHGGALAKMLPPFRMGVGGPLGRGDQWMSWITLADAVSMIVWLLDRNDARGIFNATAPTPERNRDFTRALARAIHRPALLAAPSFALRLAFGEMADQTLLVSQRVLPQRAMREGFSFANAGLERALVTML